MAREQIVFDPNAWTGMDLPPDWPKAEDYPFPAPLVAHESRHKIILSSIFFLLPGLVALASAKEINFRGVGYFAFGCVLVVVGAAGLWRAFRAKSDSQPAITLNSRGLTIPFWFEKAVPWSEIADVEYTSLIGRRRAPALLIKIRDGARFGPTKNNPWASDDSSSVALGNSYDVPAKRIFEAIQAHRAHFGREGKAA